MKIVVAVALATLHGWLPHPAAAQSATAGSAAIAYLSVGASLALAGDPASRARARTTSGNAVASLEQAGRLVVASVSFSGEMATVILRDAVSFTLFSVTLPLRALGDLPPPSGTIVRVVRSETGLILDRDGRLLAFVPFAENAHLVRSHAIEN